MTTQLLKISEAAEELRVHPDTLYGWIGKGRIKAINIAAPGTRPLMRIRREDLDKFIASSTGRAA